LKGTGSESYKTAGFDITSVENATSGAKLSTGSITLQYDKNGQNLKKLLVHLLAESTEDTQL
jgi:hypothetical protein